MQVDAPTGIAKYSSRIHICKSQDHATIVMIDASGRIRLNLGLAYN
jgi:hypothetical protein